MTHFCMSAIQPQHQSGKMYKKERQTDAKTERLISIISEMLRICGWTSGKEIPAKPICQIEKHHGERAQSLEYFLITLNLEIVGDQSSRT